jgi:hypothetical protein
MGMIGVPICAALRIGNGGGMAGMTPFQKSNGESMNGADIGNWAAGRACGAVLFVAGIFLAIGGAIGALITYFVMK